ncbi:MAG TPA: hypothetical protein PLS53_08680 [Thermoanaerobaculaceae bacterium]|nr:hypothetical protein [Thermoanaerobaculaceae bacterium]HPS78216.1 hypothetical protein [Thermoanaerobaculaceae bacterium]
MSNEAMVAAVVGALLVGLLIGVPVATAEDSADAAGFIYGQVKTRAGGSYEGFIRWGDEEAFWGDHFNSTKEDLPYLKYVPRRERRVPVEVFGIRIGVRGDWGEGSRQLVVRFGDLDSIEVLRGEDAELKLRNGTVIEVSGGSNDIGADLVVRDREAGLIEVPWRKVASVRFMAVPAGAKPYADRLFGKVTTADRSFEGFIQWDSQECLSSDKLDGESDDGKLSIEFGRIRAIERLSRSRSRVELADGRSVTLSGTNDVDEDIRGIWVEDPRVGRVKVPWEVFRRAEFSRAPSSGPAYGSYAAPTALRGTVRDTEGKTSRGRIVFDLDEAESWEMLDGTVDGVDYSIPFGMVASISPQGRHGSKVTLRNGTELRMEDSQDVSEDNSGVLVIAGPEGEPRYLHWDEVARLDLE